MTVNLDRESVHIFQQKVMDWWTENARDLPWRNDPSPYEVLVSEVMLQQTQVNRVIPKYLEFLQKFPTLEALASAETKQLLTIWRGLGYNRRALWLREAACQIITRGTFPQDVKELRELKGIGPYTSRAILIFAFNKDLAAVDTNIRRVLIASGFASESMTSREIQATADALLLRGKSCDWHNALMDYGSNVLTSNSTGISPLLKQSCFKGSIRELRGAIIRALTEAESMTADMLATSLDFDCERVDLMAALKQLITDGLVTYTRTQEYRIAE